MNLKNFVLFIFLSLPQKYKFLKWRPISNRQVQYRILCISLQKKGHGPSIANCESYCSQDQNDQAQVYRRNTHLLISFKSSEEILNVKTWKLKFQEVWNLSCNLSCEQASAYFLCKGWDWIVWDGHCPWTDPLLLSQAGMAWGFSPVESSGLPAWDFACANVSPSSSEHVSQRILFVNSLYPDGPYFIFQYPLNSRQLLSK